MVTPLADRDRLDLDGLDRLLEHILSAKVAGVFILGTSGEGPSLGYKLRQQLIEVASERIAGRVPLLVGVSDSAFAESVALAEFAADCGAQAVVATPPYYYPASQADLARYFERLAAESPLPLFLYNMPSHTKISFELDTVRRLMEVPKIVGLKDSSASMIYFHHARRLKLQRPDWTLLMGPEELLGASVLSGGDGGVCGGANLFPRLYVELFEAAHRGDLGRVNALQDEVLQVAATLYTTPGHGAAVTAGLKCALACLGVCSDAMAAPFEGLPEERRDAIRPWLEQVAPRWVGAARASAFAARIRA